jgi:hypothetical protein
MPPSVTPIHTPKPSVRLQMLLVMMRQQQQTYGRRDSRKIAS